jgi:ABC-2 type transport system ATP-binding protein
MVVMETVIVIKSDFKIIEIKNLSFQYENKIIFENLNLDIYKGSVFGLLGKNGVGKSTLINILMGYLKPVEGQCLIFNEPSHNISSNTKEKIALLHEGFISYDYMNISQVEEFLRPFYSKWETSIYFELIDLMGLDYNQKLHSLSFGQKSQVVLGCLFAQNAELLILDDYSMGLDAGYRRLFINYLKEYIKKRETTVLITSHVMNDLENLIDDMVIVQKGGRIHSDTMANFNKDKSTTFEDKFLDLVGLY